MAEKIYWVILICSIYVFYKSPSMVNVVFVQNGHFSISCIALSIIIFNSCGYYLEQSHQKVSKQVISLKQVQKDMKLQLLS